MSGDVKLTEVEGFDLTEVEQVYTINEEGGRGPTGADGADGTDGTDGTNGTNGTDGRVPTRNDLGTISGATNLDATYTETTGDFTASFTLTLTNFAEGFPSNDFTFTVSGGGTPTITLSSTPAATFWTTQTLSLLADGNYRAVFLYNGASYDVYVDIEP